MEDKWKKYLNNTLLVLALMSGVWGAFTYLNNPQIKQAQVNADTVKQLALANAENSKNFALITQEIQEIKNNDLAHIQVEVAKNEQAASDIQKQMNAQQIQITQMIALLNQLNNQALIHIP